MRAAEKSPETRAAGEHIISLGRYTEDQMRAFFADESEYTPEERRDYERAIESATKKAEKNYKSCHVVGTTVEDERRRLAQNAREDWQCKRAVRLGLDPSISSHRYGSLRDGYAVLQTPEGQNALEWAREELALNRGWATFMGCQRDAARDSALDYERHSSNMRQALKQEQDDLRVKQYALQTKQFFLKLEPRRAKMFLLELTGSEQGDWRKLLGHLDEIPDQPAKRLNPSYEKSKTFNRVLRATGNTERALLASRKTWDNAKAWNKFLDDKAKQAAPALPPAKMPKALTIGGEGEQ